MENKPFKVYCNSLQISMGVHDIILNLQNLTPNDTEELGTVSMSPQHAKVFAHMLMHHINQYEEIFGLIPTPPDEEKLQRLSEAGIVNIEREQ